ncbi:hypothetical protein FFL01_16680 [Flavobacterium flevense]|uniref:Uncharacterized protein n=2 Tax=Flavobacterium TaxID=237 RepID=A0A4Y4AXT9_9FLAO|nr:hypothetical protein FFL01_16680 [Flavobacterium flevense]
MLRKKLTVTFVPTFKIPENMFEFSQYLGFLLFLTILTMGFWLMFFLVSFVSYWVGGATWERFKEKRAKKQQSL